MAVVGQEELMVRSADVDWAERWRRLVQARQGSDAPASAGGGNRWDQRAERFARMTQNLDPRADLFASTLIEAVRPTDSVLDVGAGAGRYTMPIAPHVARVTAVEPSGGMRAQLEQQLAARGYANVTVVP